MRTKISVILLFAATACSHHHRSPPLVPESALDHQNKPKVAAQPTPEPVEESIPQPSEEVLAGRLGTLPQKTNIPSHAMAMLKPTDGYKVAGTFIVDDSLNGSDVVLDLSGVPEGTYTLGLQDDECGSARATATPIGSITVEKDGLAKMEATLGDAWMSLLGRYVVLTNQYEAQLACGVITDMDAEKEDQP